MYFARKLLIFALSFFFFAFLFTQTTLASEYFSTSYYVTYTVSENGNTNANMEVTLKNKSPQYYASSYKIQVGFENIENLKASDAQGSLSPTMTKVEEGTAIEADFNQRVVGEGNSLRYTISFDTPDIARKDGSIWEINIPGLDNAEEFDSFTAEVIVPKSFGTPSYIKPKQSSDITVFTKGQLGKSGISIAYGNSQIYTFNLFYHLKNSNVFPVKTEIALPPTTNYQDVYIEYMNPKPENVTIDKDGNWLATYRLNASQKMSVQARGNVVVHLSPKKELMSENELAVYLEEKPYWETERSEIIRLAKDLKTPRAIYDYLVKNLTYDFSRVEENRERLGALGTLREKSSAVCLEFTDLFVALARAAGIPAREIDGYAHTENSRQRPLSLVKDILHAWPEYYDREKQTWVMVDPTWGNTTGGVDYFDVLDFDHVAFVKRGVDSEYPIPAGGYKYEEDENLKDVNITFPTSFTMTPPSVSVAIDDESVHPSLLPLQATLTIANAGQGLVPSQKIAIEASGLSPALQTKDIGDIPPFGHANVQLDFEKTPLLTNASFPLTITIAGAKIPLSIRVVPLVLSIYALIGGSFVILFTAVIFIIAKKTRRVPIPEQK